MPTHDNEPITWLSVKDLADRWLLSTRTIRRIPRCDLPWAYLSDSRRYRLSDVQKYEGKRLNGLSPD